ncbi:putative Btz domain-containing protein [Lupinus albus]|uniref:Putative Btz domain-containing protein n=1 Tax=Lupinus albus TaxID=3870 RepID=A0A6A4NDY3_LUPAL|nr:putative Btz domain-containing protein [Lupinus albus]
MGSTVVEEDDIEYESDPEDTKRSLTMWRRREASDDEDDDDGMHNTPNHRVIHSNDSEGEGGVADYDDEEEELEEEEEDEGVEEEVYEERGVEEGGVVNGTVLVKDSDAADVNTLLEEEDSGNKDDEEKKENEPFAVPTAGAFYMHDDRFRDNAGAHNRRMNGGRRLWESKDERKWGHDKFEEITLQERHSNEGRRPSRGNYRGGRGRTRAINRRGHIQGSRGEYDNSGGQGRVPKGVVRGRGPQRYEASNKKSNDPASQMQNKRSLKPTEETSRISSERTLAPTSSSESDLAPAKKQVSSNLNYASPPFYPSGSSSKEINLTPKRDVQTSTTSRSFRSVDEGFSVQQNNAPLRGKNVIDSINMDKLYMDESVNPSVGKAINNLHMPPPGSSGVNASHSPHLRAPVMGGTFPVQMNYQSAATFHNRVNKNPSTQFQAIQRNSAPVRTSTSVQAPESQLGHRPGSGAQASSHTETDSGEPDTTSELGKSKGTLVGKGRGASQGGGKGFVYDGPMSNVGGSHGDQNFLAFLSVMQFGGQHPGGIGVPAVGMAFPGYVQPQHGLGSSEMTWLPVLAGAAGALGASYCPPYLTVDGAYHARQSGQTSAPGTASKENDADKANNELKPPQRPEPVSDEFGQRQNKPRRYSEMNFGQ